jgi:hypothetical protein
MNKTPILPVLLAVFSGFLGLVSAPADAGGDLGGLVRIEVLDGGLTKRGTHRAALRLTLEDGWKTYWRAPGDAGIPPRFDWRSSSNVQRVSVTWPTPQVFDLAGLRSIGYTQQLVLPVEITQVKPGQPVRLKGEIEFGVCKDICIPARLTFDQPLDPGAGRNPAIAAALAARPYSASEAGVRSATCRLSPSGNGGMNIEAQITMPSAGGTEVAVIEPGDPQLWASQTITKRRGKVLIATGELVHVSGSSFALDRSKVRITVLGKRHAVDIRGCTPG